jgi:hypothetical protein
MLASPKIRTTMLQKMCGPFLKLLRTSEVVFFASKFYFSDIIPFIYGTFLGASLKQGNRKISAHLLAPQAWACCDDIFLRTTSLCGLLDVTN